jgi:hypothetical protein
VSRTLANGGSEAARHAVLCRYRAGRVVDVFGGCSDDLLSRLRSVQELKVRKLCNRGTLRPVAGVGMACFIVASVECVAPRSAVPCMRVGIQFGVLIVLLTMVPTDWRVVRQHMAKVQRFARPMFCKQALGAEVHSAHPERRCPEAVGWCEARRK